MKKICVTWLEVMLIIGAAMLVGSRVDAATIHVPADQPTIQAAVDAAVAGDFIDIAPGVYSGPGNRDIDFHGKELVVHGQGHDLTTIDCGGMPAEHHGGFIFHSAEDSSLVNDLTIINAYYSLPNSDSGAITCRGGSPWIAGCILRNNHAHGVAITSSSAPLLTNVQISFNDGWGVWMPGYPYLSHGVRIEGSQVYGNALGGVIISTAAESTMVAGNTIVDNGGIGLFLQGDLPRSREAAAWDTSTVIERNIIAFNGGYGIYKLSFFPGLHYYRNDLYGNKSGDWLGMFVDSVCNISVDPLFCRSGSSLPYTLAGNSPCLAANNVCGVDMGAFGLGCTSCCSGMRGNVDCDAGDNTDISDLSRLIDYLFISFSPLCCAEEANIDGTGAIDISDLSRLIDYLFINLYPPESCS